MPQDDWTVVEEALELRRVIADRPDGDAKMKAALAALARLREREAQLEAALREIENLYRNSRSEAVVIARRALAHPEGES